MVTGTGTAAAVVQWVEGSVSAVEASAFSLVTTSGTGRGVRRYLLSRYANPRPVLPTEGQHVRVGLDKAGYVRLIEPLGEAVPEPKPAAVAPAAPARSPASLTPHAPSASGPEPPPSELATAAQEAIPGHADALDAVATVPDVPPLPAPAAAPPPGEPEAAPAPHAPAPRPEPARRRPGREVVVTRLACLNTATAILASGTRGTNPEAVLTLAEQLERWAMRPEDERPGADR